MTPVIVSLSEVTVLKDKRFSACFPRTVELPQLKAASKAKREAMMVLSSQVFMELVPNVTRYPPTIAITAKIKNFDVIFSFKMTAAKAIANTGWNFCKSTTTERSI